MEEEHGEFPNTSRTNVPKPCMQCENPPCVQVCPVSATYKMDDGVVNIDYDRCIGCRYCMIACPYGARYFDFGENYDDEVDEASEITSPEYGVDRGKREEKKSPVGNVRKCSFCTHRLERGEEPACVWRPVSAMPATWATSTTPTARSPPWPTRTGRSN